MNEEKMTLNYFKFQWEHFNSAVMQWCQNSSDRSYCWIRTARKVTNDPDVQGKFLCILRKKNCHYFRDTSGYGDFFSPPNFVKHYQTSEALSSCFGAAQIFVRCENRTDFTIYTGWCKEKVFKCAHDYQIENLVEAIFVEIFAWGKQVLSA